MLTSSSIDVGGGVADRYLLVVDDDAQIRTMLSDYLGDAGYRVVCVGTGADAVQQVASQAPDLVILDIILPDIDGIEVARRIRGLSETPIMMLTTKSDEVERIIGLEVGADDYLSKPFSPRELLARIRSLFRRIEASVRRAQREGPIGGRVRFADWVLDVGGRYLMKDGAQVKLSLTNSEFNLLSVFLQHENTILSREQILERSRQRPEDVFDRSVDYLVLKLRRKLEEDPRRPAIIRTEHGRGYVFSASVEKAT